MLYVLKQKFNIADLAEFPHTDKSVLLVVSEENLREIYRRHLEISGFAVKSADFGNHPEIARHLGAIDLLIMDLRDSREPDKLAFLKLLKQDFPGVSVITIGLGLDEVILQSLMALGVVGHLDRKFRSEEHTSELQSQFH